MSAITCIMGLGNPGPRFIATRHNVGFKAVEVLADKHGAVWRAYHNREQTSIIIGGVEVTLVKPLTGMNASGTVLPAFTKKGVRAENLLVVHDELEKRFGSYNLKQGGSHRGHNGLKSIFTHVGAAFHRLRIGIGRPVDREDVSRYVLAPFASDEREKLDDVLYSAVEELEVYVRERNAA